MATKLKIPCPRCDAKGVLPQYWYNKKGICFLCWGAKYIHVKVPDGKSQDEYIKELKERELEHLRNHPPKVPMPEPKAHRNPDYFKGAKTKLSTDDNRNRVTADDFEARTIFVDFDTKMAIINETSKEKLEELRKKALETIEERVQKANEQLGKYGKIEYRVQKEIQRQKGIIKLIDRRLQELETGDEELTEEEVKQLKEKLLSLSYRQLKSWMETSQRVLADAKYSQKGRKRAELALKLIPDLLKRIEEERPKEDRNTIVKQSLENSHLGEKYEVIKRGDIVRMYVSGYGDTAKYVIGEVVGISLANRQIKLKMPYETHLNDMWFKVGHVQEKLDEMPEWKHPRDAEIREEVRKKYGEHSLEDLKAAKVELENKLKTERLSPDEKNELKVQIDELSKMIDEKDVEAKDLVSPREEENFRNDVRERTKNWDIDRMKKLYEDGSKQLEKLIASKANPRQIRILEIQLDELGKIITEKEKPKRPEKELVAEVGRFLVHKRIHTKTGEEFYTVEPKERISLDEFKQMNEELKKLGGFYDRYLKRMRFKENPVEALEKLEGVKAVVSSGENDTGTEDVRERRRRIREARKKYSELENEFLELIYKGTEEQLQALLERVEKELPDDLPEIDKESLIKTIQDYIFRKKLNKIAGEIQNALDPEEIYAIRNSYKEFIDSIKDESDKSYINNAIENAFKRLVGQYAQRIGYDMYMPYLKLTPEEIESKVKDITEKFSKYPEAKPILDTLNKNVESHKVLARNRLERERQQKEAMKGVEEAKQKYQEMLKEREEIVKSGVKFKDTELGRKVAEITGGKPAEDKETAIKVGAVLREEFLKRLEQNTPQKLKDLDRLIRSFRKEIDKLTDEIKRLNDELVEYGEKNGTDNEVYQKKNEELQKLMRLKQDFVKGLADTERDYRSELFNYTINEKEIRSKIVLEILSEIREMGGEEIPIVHLKGDSNPNIKAKVKECAKFFPKEWLQVSGTMPIRVVTERNRAYHMAEDQPAYSVSQRKVVDNYAVLGIGTRNSETTIVHELGHRMENVHSRLKKIIFDYLEERTKGMPLKQIPYHKKNEKYRPSNNGTEWIHEYIGKEYRSIDGSRRATEILSMGLECVFFNTHKAKDYTTASIEDRYKYNAEYADEEYFNLILGVLASV
jgi:hypothetical protein